MGSARVVAAFAKRTDATDATFLHAGSAKLPGLSGVAVQAGVRWRRAAESAFRTPSASRSVVYTGVPGCCRQESSNPPASTASKPSSSTSCRTTALAFACHSQRARQFDQAIHEADRVRADGAHVIKRFDYGPFQFLFDPAAFRHSRLDFHNPAIALARIVVAGIHDDHARWHAGEQPFRQCRNITLRDGDYDQIRTSRGILRLDR